MGEQPDGLVRVRELLLDDAALVRAIAAGRRHGPQWQPRWRRAELRYVDLRAGRRLQVTTYDSTQAFTANHDPQEAAAAVDALLAEPFGNWHVFTAEGELQVRVTKKGKALTHFAPRHTDATPADLTPAAAAPGGDAAPGRSHDRAKPRLLPEEDPVLRALGISDGQGRVKPSRQAKYRQVEEFLRALGAAVDDGLQAGALPPPDEDDPWLLVDLGCGNAYLTFAAHRFLNHVRRLPTRVVGVDAKLQSLEHNQALAQALGISHEARFEQHMIGEVDLAGLAPDGRPPDVVVALHACDTATDDALAAAVRVEAPVVLAAPCCHHDLSAQLRRVEPPAAYDILVRDGILRERFADTLTDALRAATLRVHGYRVDVVEFVESRHTPRNTLLRAVRTGSSPGTAARADLDSLTATWQVRPRLQELLR